MHYSGHHAEIVKMIYLADLSAGSGIEFFNDSWYVVGDDVNSIYKLDKQFKLIETIALYPGAGKERVLKKDKKDLEMLSSFKYENTNYLIAAGSGSISQFRENGYLFSGIDSRPKIICLTKLYKTFREKLGFEGILHLNLEGLASDAENLYWFQRGIAKGRNAVLKITIDSFLHFIKDDLIPEVKVYYFNLGDIDGITLGFSGAVFLNELKSLLFCASAENTCNSYDDGVVAGSYLGLIGHNQFSKGEYSRIPLQIDGETFKHKLESIAIKKYKSDLVTIVGVCDNDDGTTILVEIKLSINMKLIAELSSRI